MKLVYWGIVGIVQLWRRLCLKKDVPEQLIKYIVKKREENLAGDYRTVESPWKEAEGELGRCVWK